MEVGSNYSEEFIVTEADTAKALGSGNLDVLATPKMILCMESVASKYATTYMQLGFDTVGTEINVKHLKASPIGEKFTVTATLTDIQPKFIIFSIEAKNEKGVIIGTATHTRYIIEIERFLSKLK